MFDYNIVLPSKPKVIKEEGFEGVYEIDGLYPGYGHTLGNSLRRIILSSLPGAAITSVKIDGVSHEFSSIDGVKEDVITLILNLKKVRMEMLTDEPQTITLEIKEPKDVYAKNIKVPGQVKIMNPDLYLAKVTGKTHLTIEMKVERGLGYVSREALSKDRVEIGAISLDAAFTPIRKVNYEVEQMRVGERTDFNRLRMFVETDGTITPRQAFEKAIEIMITQLKAIIGFKEEDLPKLHTEEVVSEKSAKTEVKKDEYDDTMKTRIETLELSLRTVNALANANIRTVGGLARKKEKDLLEVEGLGSKGLQEIKKALGDFGMTLKD